MSSHHIVRDTQEPALIIAGTYLSHETIGQLLEWNPVVVVTENCLAEVLNWDIKIDKIVCENTHYQSVYEHSLHQQPLEIWQMASANPADFIHQALQKLINHGHEAVSIICEDFSPKDFVQYINRTKLIVYQNNKKGYFVERGLFSKWVTAQTQFYFAEEEAIDKVWNLERNYKQTYQAIQTGLVGFELKKTIFVQESF